MKTLDLTTAVVMLLVGLTTVAVLVLGSAAIA